MGSNVKVPDETPLKFTFSAHLLEDLGVNLYTSLNKALVEFVANAYDAESPGIRIKFNASQITKQAGICRKQFELESAQATTSGKSHLDLVPLEKRTLNPSVAIVLEDEGHGMTKDEMDKQFLVVGRRRREETGGKAESKNGKRVIMGRKGLGKLAGFGIAHRVEVASRAKDEAYTTVVTLDYDALLGATNSTTAESSQEVPTQIKTTDGLKKPGTRITLSRLVYQTLHTVQEEDLVAALGRNFGILDPKDFKIQVNKSIVKPVKKNYAYAWPEDSKRKHDQLVQVQYKDEDTAKTYSFGYRLRFTDEKKYLMASERGVRIYSHNRLASFPSMLDVNSSAHGFRYSDYLDGIVVADFIDDLPTDYIATDRSDLRWETPPLAGLRKLLTEQMQKAVGKFADKKMAENAKKVEQDSYTNKVIEKADIPEHRKKTALKFAAVLASSDPKGVTSEYYKATIGEVVSSLGHGDIISTINKLAAQAHPDLDRLVTEITRSTKREFDEFLKFCQVRLKGIDGLEKIVASQDFREGRCDEKSLHKLFAKNPWLIHASFSQLLTSDERETVLAGQLAKHLQVGSHAPKGYDPQTPDEQDPLKTNKRPDLVFLLSTEPQDHATGCVIVVELKAPNTPLHSEHLEQLEDYICRIEKWRDAAGRNKQFAVKGQLIGSLGPGDGHQKIKVQRLENRIKKDGPHAQWEVRDIATVLAETKTDHKELLNIFEAAKKPGTGD
jgi:hypothetical protein